MLRSQRLELRPMTPEHLPLLAELDADPEVLRFILGRARTPREVEEFWGPRAADTEADALGLGFWVGFEPGSGDLVGWWDLEPAEDDSAEAGWRLARRWWRQGLASEGATAVLDHAFGAAGLGLVFAETMAVNAGSRGVMRRLGMTHVRTDPRLDLMAGDLALPGAEHGEAVYEITAQEWRERRRGLGAPT